MSRAADPGRPRRARWSRTACRCRATSSASGRRAWAIRASTRWRSPRRSWPAARAAGCTGASSARRRSPRTCPSSRWGSWAGRRSSAGQATVRPGVDPALVERAFEEELERLGREPVTDDELARAHALIETYELEALQRVDERADRLSMYATLLDDPDMINRQLGRYLAVGAAEIQAVAAEVLRPDNRVVLTYVPAAEAGRRPTRRPRHDARRDPGRATVARPAARPTTSRPSSGRSCPPGCRS